MAAVQVNGLRSDELQMALAYEVEPSSGVPAAEAELAFRAVPDPDPTVRVFEVVVRRRRATEGGVLRRWRVPIAVCLLLLLAFVAVDFVRTSLALSTMTHEVRTREALQAQVDAVRHAAAADRRAAEELRTRRQNAARAQDEAARLRAAWPAIADEEGHWGDSIAATVVRAGAVHNQIPNEASMVANVRFVEPGAIPRIEAFVRETSGLEVERLATCEPVVCDADAPALAALREAMAKAFGREIPMSRMHGATDARHFAGPGAAPVAMIGVEGWRCHDEGEGATLASIRAYADLLVSFGRSFAAS